MPKQAKILIVDDEQYIRDILEGLLSIQGYCLEFATNGVEALEQISASLPDLVLLDVMMPVMNGFQVCQHVKANEKWRHIPIILVTALDSKQDLAKGIDAGADDFLQKPFDNLEMLARVRSMLRIKQQYDLLEQQRQQLQTALELNEKFARVTAQHLEELEVLHEAGLEMTNSLDTDSVLSLISHFTQEIVPEISGCVMHLLSEDNHQLLPVVFSSDETKMVYPALGFEDSVAEVLKTHQTIRLTDIQSYLTEPLPEFLQAKTALILPLGDYDHYMGTLTVLSADDDVFGESHRHILSILANQAAVAFIKARFFEERRRAKEREKQYIRELFHRYVSPTVVDRLVDGVEDLVLGGKRKDISVMFADIRNFTQFSEKMAPERLVEVLNQYLALAVEAILAQEGTLDKFMGDAVMAFFNAPLTQDNHVLRAVEASLVMQKMIASYNKDINQIHSLSFGIGIHVGQAVVGNIGTVEQMNYTAIGDTVNVAKRLQENARGGQIVLSQAAYQMVRRKVKVRNLGALTVKGRMAPIYTYELLGLA